MNCNLLQGDPTEHELTQELVFRHFVHALEQCDFIPRRITDKFVDGIVVGYTPESQQTFQSFRISKAVKQTIAEHYETKTFRKALG